MTRYARVGVANVYAMTGGAETRRQILIALLAAFGITVLGNLGRKSKTTPVVAPKPVPVNPHPPGTQGSW